MSDVNYLPLIEDMKWSYSRIESFEDCPYKFYLRYINKCEEVDKFYASYGTYMHKLIEMYYTGELHPDDMVEEFLEGFSENVRGMRPAQTTVQKYIQAGVEYLKSFKPFDFNMIDVEKRVDFKIGDLNFVGIIDYLGEKDGELYIVDNKSRDLKPRSNRQKPTVKDKELDEMLKQLYIYSAAIKQEYGKFPKALCFNCFRTGVFIEEPFKIEKYNKAIKWVEDMVEEIKNTDDFYPNREYFYCCYICGVNEDCFFDEMAREEYKKGK